MSNAAGLCRRILLVNVDISHITGLCWECVTSKYVHTHEIVIFISFIIRVLTFFT
jgi:hypothetical protein